MTPQMSSVIVGSIPIIQ